MTSMAPDLLTTQLHFTIAPQQFYDNKLAIAGTEKRAASACAIAWVIEAVVQFPTLL